RRSRGRLPRLRSCSTQACVATPLRDPACACRGMASVAGAASVPMSCIRTSLSVLEKPFFDRSHVNAGLYHPDFQTLKHDVLPPLHTAGVPLLENRESRQYRPLKTQQNPQAAVFSAKLFRTVGGRSGMDAGDEVRQRQTVELLL